MRELDYIDILQDISESDYTDETEYWCNCITSSIYALNNILNKGNAMKIKAFTHIISEELSKLDLDTTIKLKENEYE